MTAQKSFKRRVRARMAKTGERYTAARRHLLPHEPAPTATPERPEPEPTAALEGRVSDEAMQSNTGRPWAEWFAILDRWGATERSHREIAAWLREEHGVPGWWAQAVTVGYEQERGLRAPGGSRDGHFIAGATKTVNVPVDRLFAAVVEPELRERWLPGVALSERTSKPGRTARFDWGDGSTRVVVGFTTKGASKSQIDIAHERLPDAERAGELKAFWRARLAALKELLETP
jgi:hypothetical protein